MEKSERVIQEGRLTERASWYRTLREQGLCANCKAESPTYSRCDACRARRNEQKRNGRKRPLTLKDKLTQHLYSKNKYRRLRDQKRCTSCEAPNDSGLAWCDACRAAKSIQAAQRYHFRKAHGLCTDCSAPAHGRVRCTDCRALVKERRKAKEAAQKWAHVA